MKSLLVLVISFFAAVASAGVNYTCQVIEGASPRLGVDKVIITSGDGLFIGRVLLNLVKTSPNGSTEISTPAVYAHGANIHKGRYAGFMKYVPSARFETPQFFAEKFPSFALQESADRKSAILAFPDSKNAVYNCQRF